MHRLTEQRLEDYLDRRLDPEARREFEQHLAACRECREMVVEAKSQSALLALLRANAEQSPAPGFYARLMERIDAERSLSFWDFFFEPAFARQLLATAALLVALMLGGFWMSGQRDTELAVLRGDQSMATLGQDRERDRDTVFLSLATYRE